MKLLDKVPILIIIVGVIATIFFFSSNKKLEEEISAAEANKVVLDMQSKVYNNIDTHYGYASGEFYANKPIVVLRGSGATEVLRIYWEKNGEIGLTAKRVDTDALEVKWGDDDGKWASFVITSKISKGYRTIRFTNKANNEAFEVLVIVK